MRISDWSSDVCSSDLLVGAANVIRSCPPCMAAEDFSFMLNQRPGHYIWMGVDQPGHTDAKLHHPDYDFNDAAIPYGIGYWLGLVDRLLPAPVCAALPPCRSEERRVGQECGSTCSSQW